MSERRRPDGGRSGSSLGGQEVADRREEAGPGDGRSLVCRGRGKRGKARGHEACALDAPAFELALDLGEDLAQLGDLVEGGGVDLRAHGGHRACGPKRPHAGQRVLGGDRLGVG